MQELKYKSAGWFDIHGISIFLYILFSFVLFRLGRRQNLWQLRIIPYAFSPLFVFLVSREVDIWGVIAIVILAGLADIAERFGHLPM